MEGSLAFGGLLLAAAVVVPALLVLAVLVIVGGRGDPDPSGQRTFALYLASVSFIALFTAIFSGFAVVAAVADIPVNEEDAQLRTFDDDADFEDDFDDGFEFDEEEGAIDEDGDGGRTTVAVSNDDADEDDIRTAVQAGLVFLAAGAVFLFHERHMRALVADPAFVGSPAWRVRQAYLYAVCFFSVLVAVFSFAAMLYGVFRAIAPGITSDATDGERKDGLVQVVTSGALTAATLVAFRVHWSRARPAPAVTVV